jgi:hypothetical protein
MPPAGGLMADLALASKTFTKTLNRAAEVDTNAFWQSAVIPAR